MKRPRRTDVTPSYDLGVDAYIQYWSPVILPPARDVVAALGLERGARVLDLGTGAGALVPSIRAAAPNACVTGLDPSLGLLRAARRDTHLSPVLGDGVALPFRDGVFDAVTIAYVLFHVSDPAAAMAEAARVLVVGGVVGNVTWMRDRPSMADQVWEELLVDAAVPPLPMRSNHDGLDSVDGVGELHRSAGLDVARIWTTELLQEWDLETYWGRRTGAGVSVQRLSQLDPDTRAEVLGQARSEFEAMSPNAFTWTGEVICSIASKP